VKITEQIVNKEKLKTKQEEVSTSTDNEYQQENYSMEMQDSIG
jgi:hypothetical protein